MSLNLYCDIAATVLFDFNGVLIDAFQSARIDGDWRIVNKFFVGS